MEHKGVTSTRRRKMALFIFRWFYRIPENAWLRTTRAWVRRTFGLYMVPREISEDIIKRLSPKGIAKFEKSSTHHLHAIHNSMGRSVRNAYGLWEPTNPWTVLDGDDLGIRNGVITDIRFPDNLSYKIVKDVHSELHHLATQRQVEARNTLPSRD